MDDPRQQDYARSLYYMLKVLDPGRVVSTNDGWEHMDENDICSLHDINMRIRDTKQKRM